jgi:hypothetical protein
MMLGFLHNMGQQLQAYSITAPGFYGLNTQDSSLDLASGYALVANNCVIDKYGRIGARKGWTKVNTSTNSDLSTNDIKMIAELVTNAGVSYVILAGNNRLFVQTSATLTTLTYGGGGTAPTITDSHWQAAALNGHLVLYQSGHDPLIFDPAVSTTTYKRISEHGAHTGTVQKSNAVISAYGRTWSADVAADKVTVQFSDLLSPTKFSGGSSGTLDTTTVWPRGTDNIVALGAHNGFLYIFGKNNILIYEGATTPSTITLRDVVTGIGCYARDTVQNTGSDLIFLSATGVRSVLRTIQEKSQPLNDLSKNVRNDLISAIQGEDIKTIKSVYSPIDGFYAITLPVLRSVYCFDTKASLQDGSLRVTTWDSIQPKSFFRKADGTVLLGKEGFLATYNGYLDNTSTYRFQYFTNHTDLGTPSYISMLKRLKVVVIGGSNQYLTMKWGYDFTGNYYSSNQYIPAQASTAYYGVSEYNTAGVEYTGGTALQTLTAYPTGSGKVIQTGYEANINSIPLSIQKIEIQAKNGKLL